VKGVESLFLILLQTPPSRKRENLWKTLSGVGGAGNDIEIFLKVEKPSTGFVRRYDIPPPLNYDAFDPVKGERRF